MKNKKPEFLCAAQSKWMNRHLSVAMSCLLSSLTPLPAGSAAGRLAVPAAFGFQLSSISDSFFDFLTRAGVGKRFPPSARPTAGPKIRTSRRRLRVLPLFAPGTVLRRSAPPPGAPGSKNQKMKTTLKNSTDRQKIKINSKSKIALTKNQFFEAPAAKPRLYH